MRLFYTVILGMMFLTSRGLAQEDKIAAAAVNFQSVLSNLQQSVQKLAGDNDQLALRDKYIKDQVLQLQVQLGQLEDQGDVLNKAADMLRDKNSSRAGQITRLEGENGDLDDHTQKTEAGIKLIQRSLDAGYQEDQRLLLRLKQMAMAILPPPKAVQSPESLLAVHLQKEKLKLMKMIYDSQQRQESLHGSILEFQKNAPLVPAAAALAHQQLLKQQIKDLEAQMASYPPQGPSANTGLAGQWDDAQLRELEGELKALERNYTQLKDLTELMSKKVQSTRMTVSENIEGKKLQGSIDDLNHKGEGLRAQLDDLRSQMVDLDKRKSHLETMVQHLQ